MGTLDPTSRVGSVRRTAVGGGGVSPAEPGLPADGHQRRPTRDEVDLSAPAVALRKLVRERILSATRRRLGPAAATARPTVRPVEIAFAGARDLDAYVGQIRARQALLIASSGEHRTPHAAARLLHRAALDGLSMTLELLHEVDRLDGDAWRAVVAIHHAMLAHAG